MLHSSATSSDRMTHKNGATACSAKSSRNVGTGIENSFLPKSVLAAETACRLASPRAALNSDSGGSASHG